MGVLRNTFFCVNGIEYNTFSQQNVLTVARFFISQKYNPSHAKKGEMYAIRVRL